MRTFLSAVLLLILFVNAPRASRVADVVFSGGLVYTGRAAAAATVAIAGETILYVGDATGARAYSGPGTEWIDLRGALVLPGLVDAHGHLANLGMSLREVSLTGTRSAEDACARVVAVQKGRRAGSWITGRGWDQNDWPVRRFPTWRDLEATEAGPVCLDRVDGHAVWLNRRALVVCGITRDTPDPPGGRIVRDERGEPTGILVDNAEKLVTAHIPPPDPAEVRARLEAAIHECRRVGLTGVHDAGTTRAMLAALRLIAAEGDLTMNVYCMLDSDEPELLEEHFAKGPSSEAGGRIVIRSVKLRADGALGSRGAALLAPYADEPGHAGLDVDTREQILEVTRAALAHGFQVGTHAIGDRGNRVVLDAYERALAESGVTGARLRIEHCQILDPADIARFARLGVIASMQPTHCTSDMPWAAERLGEARLVGAYAWRSLMDAGAVLAFGSDFPVEAADPLWGLYAAVTRQDHDGMPHDGWRSRERVSLPEAIHAFTAGAAFAAFDDGEAGEIAAGRRADLTILGRNVIDSPARDLLDTPVVYTVSRGRIVYRGGN